LAKWNGLKDSSTEKLTWKAANDMVKKLEELLRGSKAAKVPQEQIQKMENKLRKAKARWDGSGLALVAFGLMFLLPM
jgi:hypothetical protein